MYRCTVYPAGLPCHYKYWELSGSPSPYAEWRAAGPAAPPEFSRKHQLSTVKATWPYSLPQTLHLSDTYILYVYEILAAKDHLLKIQASWQYTLCTVQSVRNMAVTVALTVQFEYGTRWDAIA